jgi:hypothetical protein
MAKTNLSFVGNALLKINFIVFLRDPNMDYLPMHILEGGGGGLQKKIILTEEFNYLKEHFDHKQNVL